MTEVPKTGLFHTSQALTVEAVYDGHHSVALPEALEVTPGWWHGVAAGGAAVVERVDPDVAELLDLRYPQAQECVVYFPLARMTPSGSIGDE